MITSNKPGYTAKHFACNEGRKKPKSECTANQWTSPQWAENQRVKYWASSSSVCSFARTAQSLACSSMFASLARSAALIRMLAHSLTPKLMGKTFLPTE